MKTHISRSKKFPTKYNLIIAYYYIINKLFYSFRDGLSRNAIGRSSENQVDAIQNLTNLLRNTFSSQFVFPVLGHDDPGSSPGERLTFGDLADYWKQWLPTEAIQTFKTGKSIFLNIKVS